MANIESRDLLVIVQGKETEDGRSWNLRVVQWIVDGDPKSVKLEKRRYFTDEYGNQRTGKCEGLSIQDIEACKKHWAKIIDLMQNPPSVDQELPEDSPTARAVKETFPGAEELPI